MIGQNDAVAVFVDIFLPNNIIIYATAKLQPPDIEVRPGNQNLVAGVMG